MKCKFCGQNHPDNYMFCPTTVKEIQRKKACSNPKCQDYGKLILPFDSKFCVTCGHPISIDENKTLSDKLLFKIGNVDFNMIRIRKGSFMMGETNNHEELSGAELPEHKVILTKDYYIGETLVTQALWKEVMGDNPSCCGEGGYGPFTNEWESLPVDSVSWEDCQIFTNKLNNLLRHQLNKMKFRLPTEAEWEFAARGGIYSKGYQYAGSDNPNIVAWSYENADGENQPVARLKSNELGLYDMSGNIYEWCQDWYDKYSSETKKDPKGPKFGDWHVYRGGSCGSVVECSSVAYRSNLDSCFMAESRIGLRIALS